MKTTIRISESFKKAAKPLLKKYHSLQFDLLKLEEELKLNPHLGIKLGNNCFKIRLKITSKGKSGSARVISYVETVIFQKPISETENTVYLIMIYDKSDVETISTTELKNLIKRK